MKKEELSRAYTHKKVVEKIVSDISEFMPSDIIQAYEDGFDKAVELARDYLEVIFGAYRNKNNVIEVFLKTMEEGKA